MINWTDEQKTAIINKDKNLLVSAAAGSGKTAVLVERIIDTLIGKKINIDEFLIVTFTNAAARDMKKKIQE
ncbi:MAG: UvrD-helicase domain-containing protein, partial [Tissierellales bacterium]|nr:UvrD-helicase domain-containing protein [Tissierellales bacterium]